MKASDYHKFAREILETLHYLIPRFWADKDVRPQVGYLQAIMARCGHDTATAVARVVERRFMRPAHEMWAKRLQHLLAEMRRRPQPAEAVDEGEAPADCDILRDLAEGRLDLLLQDAQKIDRLVLLLGDCDRSRYGMERFYRFALELAWLHDALGAWQRDGIDPLESLKQKD